MSWGNVNRLFLRDSRGRIVSRRADVWSSNVDACVDCGRSDKPHEARGRCHNCYVKWRHAKNVAGTGDKARARQKAFRLTDEGERRQREHLMWRLSDPRQRELIRQTKLRYAKRNAKFAAGTQVEWGDFAGFTLRGTVLENGRGMALVQFITRQERIPHRRLKIVKPPKEAPETSGANQTG